MRPIGMSTRICGSVRRRCPNMVCVVRRKMTCICSATLAARNCWKSVCGSGHSLKYHADRGAAELWGVDLSREQLKNARQYLEENGCAAHLICSPMEADLDIPYDYFDYVYSIYGIGWTTDLDGTFQKIASCLKKDGIFIFSWNHPMNYCVAWSCDERCIVIDDGTLAMTRSYFDESYFTMPANNGKVVLCNHKMSTYVNALAKAGFAVEQIVEQTDKTTMSAERALTDKQTKAKMLPLSVIFKARKL